MVATPEQASNLTLDAFRPVVDSLDLSPLEAGGLPPLPKGVPSLRAQLFIAGSVLVHCIAIACLVAFSSARPESPVDEIPLEVVVMAPLPAGPVKPPAVADAAQASSATAIIQHASVSTGWADEADSEGRPAAVAAEKTALRPDEPVRVALLEAGSQPGPVAPAKAEVDAPAAVAPASNAAQSAPQGSDPQSSNAQTIPAAASVAPQPRETASAKMAPAAASRPAAPAAMPDGPPAPAKATTQAVTQAAPPASPVVQTVPVAARAAPAPVALVRAPVDVQAARQSTALAPAAPPAEDDASMSAGAAPSPAQGVVRAVFGPELPKPDLPKPELPKPAAETPADAALPGTASASAISPPSATDAAVATNPIPAPAPASVASIARADDSAAISEPAKLVATPTAVAGVPADVPLPPVAPRVDVPVPLPAPSSDVLRSSATAQAKAAERAAHRAEQARQRAAAAEKARHAKAVAAASRAYRLLLARRIHDFQKYPETSRVNGEQGTVLVSFSVGADGQVTSARVLRSSGHPALDAETIAAIHRASPMPKPPPLAVHSYTAPFAYMLQK